MSPPPLAPAEPETARGVRQRTVAAGEYRGLRNRAALAARHLILDRAAAQTSVSLREVEVPSILLKGPSIARWLYRSGELRSYGDVDLLVSIRNLGKAREALSELGFSRLSAEIRGDRPRAVEEWQREKDGVLLDLHHNLEGIGVPPEAAWTLLAEDVEQMDVSGEPVNVLGKPARALHLALHVAQHGPGVEQPIKDLERAVSIIPVSLWRETAALASSLAASSAMAEGLGQVPGGPELTADIFPTERAQGTTSLKAAGASSTVLFFEHLSSLDNSSKAALLVRKVFPPKEYMRSWMAQPGVPAPRLLLGYLIRPLWLLKAAIRARSERRALREGLAQKETR